MYHNEGALLSKISALLLSYYYKEKVWHEIPWWIQSFKKQTRNSGTSEAINPAANLEGSSTILLAGSRETLAAVCSGAEHVLIKRLGCSR